MQTGGLVEPGSYGELGCTGQVISIGQALGIHLDASPWSTPDWERALRNGVSWTVYMQDKWTALAHGRPSHLNDGYWMASNIDITDFEFRSSGDYGEIRVDSQSGATEVVQMVHLTRILSEILDKFYSLGASRNQDTSYLYSQATLLLVLLDGWQNNLLQVDYQVVSSLCQNGPSHPQQGPMSANL